MVDLTVASQAGSLWEARQNPYFCAADVQSFSCCERWQSDGGERQQLLTMALLELLRRAPEPSFSKVMRNLGSQELLSGLILPPTLLSSQPFDVAAKRFSPDGCSIVSNMNEVLGREQRKPEGQLCLSPSDPLCPSAQWGEEPSAWPRRAMPTSVHCRYLDAEGTEYNGEWFDAPRGPRTGHGNALDMSGQLYVGQWTDDEQSGHGEQVWPDGTRYEGRFERGLKHGHGRIWWPSGAEYFGELREDKLWGEGSYRWPDGRKFHGQWVENKMEGKGTFTWKSGPHSMYEGEYRGGKKDGGGTIVLSSGRMVTAQWKDGVMWESSLSF